MRLAVPFDHGEIYGHFGRTDVDLPWEHTDKAETLRKQAGL